MEPSGFVSRTTSTVTITAGSKLFEIAPVSGSFNFYVKGKKFTKTTTQSANWTAVEGFHFFYFDTSGTLQHTTDGSVWGAAIKGVGACVWAINWDNTNNLIRRSIEERHGAQMPGSVHSYLHSYIGTQWVSGGTLSDFTIGNGSLSSHAKFSCTDTTIADEDIVFQIINNTPQALSTTLNAPVFYRSGADGYWLFKTANTYPFIASGEAGYTGANGRACYNQYTGSTWATTEVNQGDFFLVHIVATTDVSTPIISILGQATYSTTNLAQAGATTEVGSIQGVLNLIGTEYKMLGTVIYQTATTYANAVKARVVRTADAANYIDLRTSKITGSGATVNNHSSLTGLANDDHLQYTHISSARTITAQHTFSPGTAIPPFVLSANAQGQLVTGLNADKVDGYDASSLLNASNLASGTVPAAMFDDTSHGSRAGGTLHANATISVAGFMSSTDKTKLDCYGTIITPSQITADQNDYAPTNIALAEILRLSTDTTRIITGLSCTNVNVLRKKIYNIGTNPLVIAHDNASSTDINRILIPGASNITMYANDVVDIFYDSTTARWRLG